MRSTNETRAAEPLSVLRGDAASLEPFRAGVDGAWDAASAAHLLRRSGFGAPPAGVRRLAALEPSAAVDDVLAARDPSEASQRLLETVLAVGNIEGLQSWWTHEFLHGAYPFREKLALFWHGHFATSNRKVDRPRRMLDQIELFREHGAGDFEELVVRVSRDPAMILWLDGNSNRRGRPNENYARELMELFTLGIGNYTEADVREAARAFTGWHVRRGKFWFNRNAHDEGEKVLFGGERVRDGAEVVHACVARRASSRWIAGKLFRYYVHPRPDESMVEALADAYEASGRHIGSFLERLLKSRVFFSEAARRSMIGGPVDYAIGTLRTLEARAAPRRLSEHLRFLGQDLFQPPSVKGWDGGREWMGATGAIARLRFALELVRTGKPLHAQVAWEGLGEGDAVGSILERLFAGESVEPLVRAVSAAAGGNDRLQVLAACLQLPEYQMI